MQWEAIYAELANKLRWSISHTGANAGINYTFQESMNAANYVAGDLLKLMKIKAEKPDYRVPAAEELEKVLRENP